MKTSRDDLEYLAESDLLDSMYEFHPEFFVILSMEELADLKLYYRVGLKPPPNFLSYRKAIIKSSPKLPARAQAAYRRILFLSGIEIT